MFREMIANIVVAPIRAVAVVADYMHDYDCLEVADKSDELAERIHEEILYVLGE